MTSKRLLPRKYFLKKKTYIDTFLAYHAMRLLKLLLITFARQMILTFQCNDCCYLPFFSSSFFTSLIFIVFFRCFAKFIVCERKDGKNAAAIRQLHTDRTEIYTHNCQDTLPYSFPLNYTRA